MQLEKLMQMVKTQAVIIHAEFGKRQWAEAQIAGGVWIGACSWPEAVGGVLWGVALHDEETYTYDTETALSALCEALDAINPVTQVCELMEAS